MIATIPLLLAAAAAIAADPAAPEPAPPPAEATAFAGHHYRFHADAVTWAEARQRCASAGGHLVTIASAEEDAFVHQLTKHQRAWLGASNEADEKVWVWIDGSAWSYIHWDRGQPDHPQKERWLKMKDDGAWDDGILPCGFVCEWDR